jgi:hypothetical protein
MYLFWNPKTDMRLAVEAKSEDEAQRLAEETLKSMRDWFLETKA